MNVPMYISNVSILHRTFRPSDCTPGGDENESEGS